MLQKYLKPMLSILAKAAYVICLKKMPAIVDNFSVEKVCVDDFAIRKRFSYGTVMVDLETHKIIDMISSRDSSDVKEWLQKFPNIKVISRDGAPIYASASSESHPDAMQVSDRFHLIKGLSEAIDRYIMRTYPIRVEIPTVTVTTEEMKALLNIRNRAMRIRFAQKKRQEGMSVDEIAFLLHSGTTTIWKYLKSDPEVVEEHEVAREKQHKLAVKQKQEDIDEVRKLFSEGMSMSQISKEVHHTAATIKRYLDPDFSATDGHYNNRIPNKLAPYETDIISLRSKGYSYPRIHKIITEKGYHGSVASLRMFMQKERVRNTQNASDNANSDYCPKEYVQRKALSQLIYKPVDKVKIISQEQFDMVVKTYPLLAELYSMIKEFNEIIFSKKADNLDDFLDKIENYNIPDIQAFVNGVRKDIVAVKNGIICKYNNGLAEGSVNKIKVIKRTMYGRNSFELLKAKVLFHEQFCC